MHSPIKRNVLRHKINTKKIQPGLVTSYDIRPGNEEDLFLFQRLINLSLAYLLTAPGPTMGYIVARHDPRVTSHVIICINFSNHNTWMSQTNRQNKTRYSITRLQCEYRVCVCVSLCTTVVHNTAQNSSDNCHSYPPDNHHSLHMSTGGQGLSIASSHDMLKCLFMATLWKRAGHYIFAMWFLLVSFFLA